MLFIQKYDETPLPEKFHLINNVCAIIYDQITDVFRFKDYENFRTHNIQFDNTFKKDEIESFESSEELIQYLIENNYWDDITGVFTKNIASAIISDLSHFIYEAIDAAKKCKVTVAFSLIRKPFTDELTILERLFNEPKLFIENFYIEGDIRKYDPSSNSTSNKLNHKELTQECISKLKYNTFLFSSMVHEIRYDKTISGAIQELTNKSIHIVTNNRNYKTEAKSLNFIFDASSNVEQYLEIFYINTHYLLLYTSAIIDELYFKYLTNKEHDILRKSKALRRFFGMALSQIYFDEKNGTEIFELIHKLFEIQKMKCSNCLHEFNPTTTDFEFYFFEENLKCPKCLDITINSEEEFKDFVNRFEVILNVKSEENSK